MTSRNETKMDRPLLAASDKRLVTLDGLEWPESVKLYVPKEWKSSSEQCYLKYCQDDALIKVVSVDEPNRVLDIIDIEDMIGAALEISLESSSGRTQSSPSEEAEGDRAYNEPQSNTLNDTQGSAILSIYVYPRHDPTKTTWLNWCGITSFKPKPQPSYERPLDTTKLGNRYAHHRKFQFLPTEDLQKHSQLLTALRKLANGNVKPQKFLAILNPFSGKRNAETVFENTIGPVLQQSNIDVEVCITTHANHACERMAKTNSDDISNYDGLVLLGGDGIIHEVINGIMTRDDMSDVLKRVKIGVVGCGTCNGFSNFLTHTSQEKSGILQEAFLIGKGRSKFSDISRYSTSSKSYFSHLTFSWALVADADIESECVRWLGQLRVEVWTAICILRLRRYRARFSYLPADSSASAASLPPLGEALSNEWKVIEDDFVVFWASQSSHAGKGIIQSPDSTLDDGLFRIMLVRGKCPRLQLLRVLLATDSGSHVGMAHNEMIDCKAYRLEPLVEGSFNDLDGEVIESGPIQARVLPRALQIFSNPP